MGGRSNRVLAACWIVRELEAGGMMDVDTRLRSTSPEKLGNEVHYRRPFI